MKIAVLEPHPMVGGGQKVAALVAEFLVNYGHDVMMLTPKPVVQSWWEGNFGVDFSKVKLGTLATRHMTEGIRAVLPDDYDVLLNMEYLHWAVDPSRATRRLIFAHDAHPIDRPTTYLDQYHGAIGCSEYSLKKLRDEGWEKHVPCSMLYPPIYYPEAPTKKLKRILVVGRWDKMRGWNAHPLILEGFKQAYDQELKDYELVFAGWMLDQEVYTTLLTKARGYPVSFVASPSNSQLTELYRSAEFLVNLRGIDSPMPTTAFSHEALGLVTVEAIAHHVVPIVHGFAGHVEVVPDPELHITRKEDIASRLIEIVRGLDTETKRGEKINDLQEHCGKTMSSAAFFKRVEGLGGLLNG